ncbi:MAG: hypothetical protein ND866_26155 [Pyrinomonadaceae bacterium]|nr:hypothetical protein [Pyrinomonadaceae bacterium]
MSNYWFRVDVDRVICRDTESLHSSDKLALSGALMTDTHIQGFVLPMIQINDGETRRYPDDLSTIFNGGSSEPRIGIAFLGWDLDQDDSWAENKEEIITVSEAISTGVKVLVPTYGPIVGAVLDGVIAAVPPIIDKFNHWDQKDKLLDHREIVDGSTGEAYQMVHKPLSIRFNRSDSIGYSDWDYTLELTMQCTWTPSFSSGGIQPGEQPNQQPYKNSPQGVWHGVWEATDVVVEIQPHPPLHYIDVVVTENVAGQIVTTKTEQASLSQHYVELEPVPLTPTANVENGSAFEQSSMTAQAVRNIASGRRAGRQEVLIGAKRQGALSPQNQKVDSLLPNQQFQGDSLRLNNDASLEIYHLLHHGQVVGQALRYRRPTSNLLTVRGVGLDRMLFRKTLLG